MSTPAPTSPALVVEAYLLAVCAPLVDTGAAPIRIEHGPGFGNDYTYRVLVSRDQIRFLLGRGGENAEAVRRLARARSRALNWSVHVDVRIVAA